MLAVGHKMPRSMFVSATWFPSVYCPDRLLPRRVELRIRVPWQGQRWQGEQRLRTSIMETRLARQKGDERLSLVVLRRLRTYDCNHSVSTSTSITGPPTCRTNSASCIMPKLTLDRGLRYKYEAGLKDSNNNGWSQPNRRQPAGEDCSGNGWRTRVCRNGRPQ